FDSVATALSEALGHFAAELWRANQGRGAVEQGQACVKNNTFVTDGPERLAQCAEGGSVGRMGVDHAIHIRARFVDLRVNEHFRMALVLPFDFLAVQIDDNAVLRANLFAAEAIVLHEHSLLPWNS